MCPFFIFFFLLQGFPDTSLSVGEAAAVLRNYERRTGETLSREDLEEHRLAKKLTPKDYDLKCQVPPPFFISPYVHPFQCSPFRSVLAPTSVFLRDFHNFASHYFGNHELALQFRAEVSLVRTLYAPYRTSQVLTVLSTILQLLICFRWMT